MTQVLIWSMVELDVKRNLDNRRKLLLPPHVTGRGTLSPFPFFSPSLLPRSFRSSPLFFLSEQLTQQSLSPSLTTEIAGFHLHITVAVAVE